MLKISEISALDGKAINQKVSDLRKELFDMRLQRSTTNIEKTHLFKENKRDIARLLTVLNSKESK
jgi:large subunit ribosomal protein L29